MATEETIRVALTDDASAPAGTAAAALDRLDKELTKLDGREIDVKTGGLTTATLALGRLRAQAAATGSAMASFNAGLDPSKIGAATAAATKLASVFDLMKNRANEARAAEKRMFDEIEARGSRVPTALQPGAAPKELNGFQKLVGVVNGLFGQQAAGGLVRGAASLSTAADKLGPAAPLLADGGKLLAVGAAAAAVAAAALVAGAALMAAHLLQAGAAMSIAQTSARESFVGPLAAVLKDAKAAADVYDAAIEISVKLGLDKEDTLKRAKELAGVGFRGAEISVAIGAVADVRAAMGDEKGQAFQKTLEKLKVAGKLNDEVFGSLKEAGIQGDAVLQKLAAKLGVSVEQVKAKLKAGSIDVATGMAAIIAAAKDQTGSAASGAANTVPALIQSAKTLLESMFDSVDLQPIKDALKSVLNVMTGPDGEKFKAAVNTLFGTLFRVLGAAFSGKDGEARISRFVTAMASAMEGAARIMEQAGPQIITVIDGLSKIFDRSGSTSGGSWFDSLVSGALALSGALIGVDFNGFLANVSVFKGYLLGMGSDMIAGLVQGITSGAANVVTAMVNVVKGAISAANAAIGRKSPARATIDMGADTSKGLELGLVSRISQVQRAGQTMIGAALPANDNAGASAGQGAAAATAQGGSTGSLVVNVYLAPPAGATAAEVGAMSEAASEAAYREWRRNLGRFTRDERRAS